MTDEKTIEAEFDLTENESSVVQLINCLKWGYCPPIHVIMLDDKNDVYAEFTIDETSHTPEELAKRYVHALAKAIEERMTPEQHATFDGILEEVDRRLRELIAKIQAGEYPVDAAPPSC